MNNNHSCTVQAEYIIHNEQKVCFSSKSSRWGNLFCQTRVKDNESLSDNTPAVSHVWVKVGQSEKETRRYSGGGRYQSSGTNLNLTCVCTIWNIRCGLKTFDGCCLFTLGLMKHLQLLTSAAWYSFEISCLQTFYGIEPDLTREYMWFVLKKNKKLHVMKIKWGEGTSIVMFCSEG